MFLINFIFVVFMGISLLVSKVNATETNPEITWQQFKTIEVEKLKEILASLEIDDTEIDILIEELRNANVEQVKDILHRLHELLKQPYPEYKKASAELEFRQKFQRFMDRHGSEIEACLFISSALISYACRGESEQIPYVSLIILGATWQLFARQPWNKILANVCIIYGSCNFYIKPYLRQLLSDHSPQG
jgi:hypothetical protein